MNTFRGFALLLAVPIAAGCTKGRSPDSAEPQRPAVSVPEPTEADRAEAKKRLTQIGTAVYDYLKKHQGYPLGTPSRLSWRVQILPELGEANLFNEFNFAEPWDSAHNKKLIDRMPEVYKSPGKAAPVGSTHLRSFVGDTAITPRPGGGPLELRWNRRVEEVQDGTAYTLFAAEAADPVDWTNPDELPFPGFANEPKPLAVPRVGGVYAGGFHGIMCEGTVHFFPTSLSDESKRQLIRIDDGKDMTRELGEFFDTERTK